jgi:hypothetical protein
MKRLALATLVVALLVVSFTLTAEEKAGAPEAVVAHCEKALVAAKAADWAAVVKECQKAIDEAQKMTQGSMGAAFPDAPTGWTASELNIQRMAMGASGEAQNWIHLSRKYTHTESKVVVEALLTDWNTLVQAQKPMLGLKDSPMAAQMGLHYFEKAGYPCLKLARPGGRDGMMVAYGKKRMLQLNSRPQDLPKLELIFNAFDLKKALTE